jgi:hypothetical protein
LELALDNSSTENNFGGNTDVAVDWCSVLFSIRSHRASMAHVLCPDLFKELIVLWACFPNSGLAAITLVIIGKILFEWLKGSSIKPKLEKLS